MSLGVGLGVGYQSVVQENYVQQLRTSFQCVAVGLSVSLVH